jgi:hypothetical protein
MGSNIVKLINAFLILTSLSLIACSYSRYAELSEFKVEYDLVLYNESGYDIKLLAFSQNVIYDEINLKNKQKILKRVSYLPRENGKYNIFNIFKYDENLRGARDSVIIIFDEKRKIIQSCNNKSIDLCPDKTKRLTSIYPHGIKKGRTKRKFFEEITDLGEYSITLTKEDYDRAVPIVK